MRPRFLRVINRIQETVDVVTLDIGVPQALQPVLAATPGQFDMLYAFGVGEVPISLSGDTARIDRITHTIRAVGPVSRALSALVPGDSIGVRGPFGIGWPMQAAIGHDVLLVAGGIGMMPLRSALMHLRANRGSYGRVMLVYGSRRRDDLLFCGEFDAWRQHDDIEVHVTLNEADADWTGRVGFVTAVLPDLRLQGADTVAMLCGPEIMFRATGRALTDLGLDANRIHVSMERNMKCALGTCGHCQLGAVFTCRDGPVLSFDRADALMGVPEL